MKRRAGFTLLELSIVLVIIGLVVGGVLVGTDLIKSAKLQKVVREAQSYANAVSTFKLKYNGLPGDLLDAESFFPDQVWNASAASPDLAPASALGDGVLSAAFEGADAWRQLALAGLINASNLSGSESCGADGTSPVSCDQRRDITAPGSAYSDKATWFIGHNLFTQKNAVMISSTGGGFYYGWNPHGSVLTSLGVRNIDTKLDDGLPRSGSVRPATHGDSRMSSDETSPDIYYKCLYDAGGSAEIVYAGRDGEVACTLVFPLGI